MPMNFDEVATITLGNTLGKDIDVSRYHHDFIIECDGVLTGREQILFLLNELKENYMPDVEMTADEADIILGYLDDPELEFSHLLHSINRMGGFRDKGMFLHLSEENLMQVWLYPESIKVVE